MELTPGQQDQLQRLLEDELRQALRDALERTDAAAVGDLVADRRRALEALAGGPVHDRQDPLDQGGEGDAVTEQH
ncbi:hypothetical protein KOI35_43115 [Actinoplanes bogorensis]|uniref:Uncharacterized protein n=1 Tax=Paractinoplanes bogorensis TaxID=1610840 RepID=A0ABS5Z3P4_9ACTN|nr:hypothetical protein [Actinoplanes bogorensis]MBU2670315.1 hypothetical protein [Actinoplanes bogorensis]